MNVEHHEYPSRHLNRKMPFKIYGHAGKPLLVFPSSGGRYYEYEGFKMIDAVQPFIDRGLVRIYTADSVDKDSWLNQSASPGDKARMHNVYDRYIVEELVPFIREHAGWQGKLGATGCSMGGYHSANFFFRHPDVFDLVISLSGIYDARFFTDGDLSDTDVYLNSPVDYLRNLEDPFYLDHYREADIIICTGQGAWENESIRDTKLLEEAVRGRGIPAWFDYWGFDVNHDWPWWREQIAYFLGILEGQNKL